MRKNVLCGTALALALPFLGTAAEAAAKPAIHHHATAHHKKPWVATGHHWHNWGAAPFALTREEAYSNAKLDKFFADATSTSNPDPMPADVEATFRKLIHDHPEGTPTYLGPGETVPLMESADGPMFSMPVDKFAVSYGIVKAAQIVGWAVRDTQGRVWTIGYPIICFNWSVFSVTPPVAAPSAPPKPPCVAIHIEAQEGDEIHIRDIALADLVPDECGPTLQEFGEAKTAANLPDEHFCDWDDCSFAEPAADARDITGKPVTARDFPVIAFKVKKTGDQILWLPRQVLVKGESHWITLCVTYKGHQSYAAAVLPTDYADDAAYVFAEPSNPETGKPWDVPSDWHGKPHQVEYVSQ
ncbi:MAG: hypothetical protein P4M11_00615 [Candidatus Pacebacteria bacterium]|nr:hypothetical protein [Candidatus Paceibacterota bacterium]